MVFTVWNLVLPVAAPVKPRPVVSRPVPPARPPSTRELSDFFEQRAAQPVNPPRPPPKPRVCYLAIFVLVMYLLIP